MLSLGIFVNLRFPRWKLMFMTVFFRMGIGFLLGLLIAFLTGLEGMDRMVVIMASAMPIGMLPLVYASTEGMDTEFAAACISLSIIIGIVITPLLLAI
jgi:predicted permease